jgi:DNA-binding MarR family transcriptional regulator
VLEERGFVRTSSRQDDARVRTVSLTPAGAGVLSAALVRRQEAQDAVQERFGAERLRALLDELVELSAVVGGDRDGAERAT